MTTDENNTSAAPVLPPSAGDEWGDKLLAVLARLEDDPTRELEELLDSMPVDASFFTAFDTVMTRLNLFRSPNAPKEYLERLRFETETRITRRHDALKSLVNKLQARATALVQHGVNSPDPLVRVADILAHQPIQRHPEYGTFVVLARFPPSHVLADITPAQLAEGAYLAVGTNAHAICWRKSTIRKNTDLLRIHLENKEADLRREEELRRREAERQREQKKGPADHEVQKVAALRKQQGLDKPSA